MKDMALQIKVSKEFMELLQKLADKKFTSKSAIVRELVRLEAERILNIAGKK